jgi:23S rRNA (cytidine1920-2'-O)/16S rRNA (cytidine1409-2'-O)-methyltransferase
MSIYFYYTRWLKKSQPRYRAFVTLNRLFDSVGLLCYASSMNRIRLDVLVHQRGLAGSREKARGLILAGQVCVAGQVADRASMQVDPEVEIVIQQGLPYVSRGGLKLEHALDVFNISPEGRIVADVGASTGGFTDCLLQRGAARVYAIDVGYGQLAWRLRQDSRVVVMERINARYLEALPEPVSLVTVDVSFISLRLILPQVRRWLTADGQVIALIKPQFEAGPREVGKGGVVRDEETHRAVLRGVVDWGMRNGWSLLGLTRSPIKGPKGNIEFLARLSRTGQPSLEIEKAIEAVLAEQICGK